MDSSRTFSPYSPNTPEDRRAMLEAVGVGSVEELLGDIPSRVRGAPLALPEPLSEQELVQELEVLASANRHALEGPCFLGAGAYRHFIPAVVRAVASRGEFLTAYTPYQPEVSQGTLQAAYEFQTLVCQLLAMDVANAGMYDGASSLAEAALMACRVTGRSRVAHLNTLSPFHREVVATYAGPQEIDVQEVDPAGALPLRPDTACLLVQHPNFFGYLEDLPAMERLAHASGALLVVATDPMAMGLFRPPGEYGADIAIAEGQSLGIPLSFGGPYIGLFACRAPYLRQMPGRIVGRTVDARGETGYVLTLQTREQHIRRERATSNICTSQALMGLMVAVYLATLGKAGLREAAELCYHKAHYAASLVQRVPGYSLPLQGTFFREFVVQCPRPPAEINQALLERGILGGLDISHLVPQGWLLCVTELNSRREIEDLVRVLRELA
ncbi:MAG: aminomethyl-transferring glycine dehydrogenase subunit GcvPA [Chloroflexi bacterium]|nr:aminomethyl-transferring glycine dehydrogenase subunit GcvPA [Chloroflexota bacterium]